MMRITKSSAVLSLVVALVIGQSVSAMDIEGTYSAKGANPEGKGEYVGNVIISRTKDSYKLVWNVGMVYIGTGIVVDNVLSVAYTDENKNWFGVVAYRILDDGKKLQGMWCAHNDTVLGKETLEKK